MKKWITDRPYLVTSAIFLVIIVFGWLFLYWQEEDYAFVLLLYLIVTLGIRMDDISRKIGGVTSRQPAGSEDKETIISRLNDIQTNLVKLNATLDLMAKNKCKEDPESTKNQ
jgi:hypothetical protein